MVTVKTEISPLASLGRNDKVSLFGRNDKVSPFGLVDDLFVIPDGAKETLFVISSGAAGGVEKSAAHNRPSISLR